ncbi:uncharacterized protein LOC124294122 isoform X1 [Neodiprion lecontei]|uniref:Uncharacterized protein LOC124294122 isoform X1 n=1 Tax=Neodiprion lecontei TaxID=441921 RepID=A0ABM3G186_NEOLC|nr:uncharacterized protein LOC124294122 isoform X1 [Neodiprion lecontei]
MFRFDVWFAAILVLGGFEPLVGLRFARGRQGRWKKWSDVRISPRKNPSQLSKQRIVCASVGLGDPGLGTIFDSDEVSRSQHCEDKILIIKRHENILMQLSC